MENLIGIISNSSQTINRNRNNVFGNLMPKSFIEYKTEEKHFGYYNNLLTLNLNEKLKLDSKSLLIKEIINTFSFLNKDWDGYGGYPPSQIVIQNSKLFLDNFPYKVLKDIDEENIFPNPNGTISIEWRSAQNVVGVEIGREYGAYFSIIDSKFEKGEKILHFSSPTDYSDLISKIEKV